jgi:hypothetical protein
LIFRDFGGTGGKVKEDEEEALIWASKNTSTRYGKNAKLDDLVPKVISL